MTLNHCRYTNLSDMENAITNMTFLNGRTNTSGGLRTLRHEIFTTARGDRAGIDNAVVVMTDGVPTIEAEKTLEEARLLRELADAEIYVIGVTDNVNATILRQISSQNDTQDSHCFFASDFTELLDLTEKILNLTCRSTSTSTTTTESTTTSSTTTTSITTSTTMTTTPTTSTAMPGEGNSRLFRLLALTF